MERFKCLDGGPESFPIDRALKEVEQSQPGSGYDKSVEDRIRSLGLRQYSPPASHLRRGVGACNHHLLILKKRAACEVVLWGAALPETVEETALFERKSQEVIAEALEMERAEAEEQARRREEEEQRRRESEERARQRAEEEVRRTQNAPHSPPRLDAQRTPPHPRGRRPAKSALMT